MSKINPTLVSNISNNADIWAGILDKYRERCAPIRLPANSIIYLANDEPRCYYVKSGSVKAFDLTLCGQEFVYNTLESGSVIMELSTILHLPLPISFVTCEESLLIRIPYEVLIDSFKDTETAIHMLTSISTKFDSLLDQVRSSDTHSTTWRVCNILVIYADRYGRPFEGTIMINHKFTQQDLADILHVSRISVSRVISELKKNDLLYIINGKYCIHDYDKLISFMNYIDINR